MSISAIRSPWLRRTVLVVTLPVLVVMEVCIGVVRVTGEVIHDLPGAVRDAWRGLP